LAQYFTSDFERQISKDAIRAAETDVQLDVMRTWFYQNYEDPAEHTPHDSSEGGYIWIWGGPYDALEELESEFSGVVPDEVINSLAQELEDICWQWAPIPSANDHDHMIEDIALITEYFQNFSNAIIDVEKLLTSEIDDSVSDCFLRLLYVNVITALETYLSDAFINTVMNIPDLMRRFVETAPEFQKEKVPFADLFKEVEGAEEKVRTHLDKVVWHNFNQVIPMYKATLDIEFPENLSTIIRAVLIRHDIVHRNGRTKEGLQIPITKADISNLINSVKEFVQCIDLELATLRSNQLTLQGYAE